MERSRFRKIVTSGGIFCLIAVASFILVRCGGSSPMTSTGLANVTLSDPPSCTNQFSAVWVTVTGVMAHTSASAAPNAAGWQNLTTQLSLTSPMQLNLFNLNSGSTGECLLKKLGSDQSLPEGSYQQIRLMLADNGGSAPTVSGNACTNAGLPNGTVDCVEDTGGNWYPLELSSQDVTGLKIPPGQIVGGPINVAAGKTVDININFNTCSSLVRDPAHQAYRLNPTLTASQVSPNTSGISGTVVSGTVVTGPPIGVTAGGVVAGATVNLELPGGPVDSANGNVNTNTIYDTAVTDTNGNFYFCPLTTQAGGIDVVADAPAPTTGTPGSVAGATIIEGVPNGTKLSSVPIVPESGTPTTAGELSVTLSASSTTSTGTGTFPVTLDLFPLQLTASSGGYEFIVPALNNSTGESVTMDCPFAGGSCTLDPSSTSPSLLDVPASDPLVGAFNTSGGTITWNSAPALVTGSASTGNYVVEADGSVGNSPAHTCTTAFSTPPSAATAGSTTSLAISVSGCQ